MSPVGLDSPRKVRRGEELDMAALEAYLKDAIPDVSGPLVIEQFPSGYSNLTYLIRVGETEMVLRRPPYGSKVKSAHDMGREYGVLSKLHPVYPAAPKPLAYCEDEDVLGAPFYVMQRISGAILRGRKPEGFAGDPKLVRACCESLVQGLADLHAIDYEAAGLGEMRREGSYVERQVKGWNKRYFASQTDNIPTIAAMAKWLESNYPEDSGAALIHNDFKFDNVVLDPTDLTHIVGVLDWEMCTIGDPLMDLGTSMSYWQEPGDPSFGAVSCFLTIEPGAYTRIEVAERYAERTGRDIANVRFYYLFALMKLAVIVQQIYYRYKQGLTQDERFASLILMVAALGQKAQSVIEGESI